MREAEARAAWTLSRAGTHHIRGSESCQNPALMFPLLHRQDYAAMASSHPPPFAPHGFSYRPNFYLGHEPDLLISGEYHPNGHHPSPRRSSSASVVSPSVQIEGGAEPSPSDSSSATGATSRTGNGSGNGDLNPDGTKKVNASARACLGCRKLKVRRLFVLCGGPSGRRIAKFGFLRPRFRLDVKEPKIHRANAVVQARTNASSSRARGGNGLRSSSRPSSTRSRVAAG